jgi:hypothetical protein
MTHLVCAILIFIPNVFSKTIFFLIYRKFGPALENFYDLLSSQQSIILPKGKYYWLVLSLIHFKKRENVLTWISSKQHNHFVPVAIFWRSFITTQCQWTPLNAEFRN